MKENIKPYLFLQCWGLGDIIFCQSIAHYYIQKGHSVIWPVKDEYFDGVNKAYPKINWVHESIVLPELFNIKEKVEVGGLLIMPIRWSDTFMKVPYKEVMVSKYTMNDLKWETWKHYAKWERSFYTENELFKALGLQSGEKYNLINTRFGSGTERNIEIKCENGYKNVELKIMDGFSMFDWQKVIMEAQEIHTVSTSLLYMLEVLPLTMPIHLYCRKPLENDFSFVSFLFTKNYKLHL